MKKYITHIIWIIIVIIAAVIFYNLGIKDQASAIPMTSVNTTSSEAKTEKSPVVSPTSKSEIKLEKDGLLSIKTSAGYSYSVKYPSTWTHFIYSCNLEGISFWPKAPAPQVPAGNACPLNQMSSAHINVVIDGTPQIVVTDNSYYEEAKLFTITSNN